MDELTRIRQLVPESELRAEARAEELWKLLLDSPEFGLRELIEDVGMDTTQARKVLMDARIGDSPALYMIALGRQDEVREALLRMIHGHY